MDDNTAKVLLATVPAAISAAVTWVVTRTSQKRFYAQRWWERKAQTYDTIVENLSSLHLIFSELVGQERGEFGLSDAYRAELDTKLIESSAVIRKLARTSDFLITPIAAAALSKLAIRLDIMPDPSDFAEFFESQRRNVEQAAEIVKAEALADLKVSD
jgi:hypothetical protein